MAGLAGSLHKVLDALGLGASGAVAASLDTLWGSILSTYTTPAKAGAAVEGLRDAGLIEPAELAQADPSEVAEATGLPAESSALAPLRRVAGWLAGRGGFDRLDTVTTEGLRDELRSLRGVGPNLAEAILLGGLGRAAYPVDRATYRVLVRHAWIEPEAGVEEVRAEILDAAERDPGTLVALADAMERVGSKWCKPSVAKCDRCPLAPLLPEGGPRGEAE